MAEPNRSWGDLAAWVAVVALRAAAAGLLVAGGGFALFGVAALLMSDLTSGGHELAGGLLCAAGGAPLAEWCARALERHQAGARDGARGFEVRPAAPRPVLPAIDRAGRD